MARRSRASRESDRRSPHRPLASGPASLLGILSTVSVLLSISAVSAYSLLQARLDPRPFIPVADVNITAVPQPAPFNLSAYALCYRALLPNVGSQASGVTWSPVSQTWWLLRGDPGQGLYEFRAWPNLTFLRVLRIPARDPEAVTWMSGYTLAVSDESDNSIQYMDVTPAPGAVAETRAPLIGIGRAIPPIPFVSNKGMEGIAPYNPNNASTITQMLLAQQEDPKRVINLNLVTGSWQVLFNLDAPLTAAQKKARQESGLKEPKELSDMYVTPDGRIFVISKSSQLIAELGIDGTILQNLTVDLPNPEGLAFTPDGQFMIVASEGQTVGSPSSLAVYRLGTCDSL